MAEKLVSPGVFTQEKDLSFLPVGIGQIGAALIGPATKGPAFRPTVVSSYQEFIDIFGDLDSTTYLPYTAKSYLRSAGAATIVRVMGQEPWTQTGMLNLYSGSSILATLAPISDSYAEVLALSGSIHSASAFTITSSQGKLPVSFTPTSPNYIANLFSTSPVSSGTGLTSRYYLYRFFPDAAATYAASATNQQITTSSYTMTYVANKSYAGASTPYITSQVASGQTFDLFKIGRISDGLVGNYDIKVAIEDIKKPGSIPGTAYGSFNIFVRRVGGFLGASDTDQRQEVLEAFVGLNLDPGSPNYILKRIGDMYSSVDMNTGKVTMNGDYPNQSKYIYIKPVAGFDTIPANLYPAGFRKPALTVQSGSANGNTPLLSYVTRQGTADTYDKRVDYGFDFYSNDSKQLLWSFPDGHESVSANYASDFNLDYMFSHNSASGVFGTDGSTFSPGTSLSSSVAPSEMLKFAVPFQGGHEGMPYNRTKKIGSDLIGGNIFGFDCSTANSSGSLIYKTAINIFANADEYDINLMVTPGIIDNLSSGTQNIVDTALQVCENRGDAFYIVDTVKLTDNITQAVASVNRFDTNYAATYYPWVKIEDSISKKLLWVPPSVVVPGVYSNNDKLGYEWFAPAGLNRGGISEAKQAYFRLTQADRDQLYLNRINPIASFPNIGVCVWGQKTLQTKASALDRINVRRLLIATKKYIASATKYLVFEQNTTATRNRFLNIVNPYLDSVKQRQGLYAFKVVMDDKNNTPDLIDRNIMYGQIFLQPSRTAEFILIDFNILPTGASFTNA